MAKRGPKSKGARTSGPATDANARWEAPGHLDGEARTAWEHLVGLLRAAGNLDRTDPVLVEMYAINVSLLREAQRSIQADGLTMMTAMGTPKANPACAVANAASMRLKAIVEALGLCPATAKYAAAKAGVRSGSKWDGILGVVG